MSRVSALTRYSAWLKAWPAVLRPLRAQADRVDVDLALARQLEHLVVGDERGRVLAVREQHDRAAAQLGRVLVARQVLERDVERVVQGRRPRGLRAPDRRLERGLVAGEGLQRRGAVVELDDLGQVLRPQRLGEADRRPPAPSAASPPSRPRCRSSAPARSAGSRG